MNDWQIEREQIKGQITALRRQGICYLCHDLETGEVFGRQTLIYDDERLRAVLESYPRMPGHTIVIWKPHREDISELRPGEAGELFEFCVRLVRAIKQALGAEKVYLNTMCDGGPNHLHIQLLPRYPGDEHGSRRFVSPRGLLQNGPAVAGRIRDALQADRPADIGGHHAD